jgi:hypothetical protein
MTRNFIALVSQTLRTDRNRTTRTRWRNAGLTLESLEVRLALSSVPAAPVPLDLNPQPLPPGVVRKLNPVAPEHIQGNHIGTSVAPDAIQGNHIGTSVATPEVPGDRGPFGPGVGSPAPSIIAIL